MSDLKCYRCGAWPCTCADGQTIIHGDCRDLIDDLPLANVIITDPPYTSLDVPTATGTTTRLVSRSDGKDWFPTLGSDEILSILARCRQKMHPDGAVYIFADVKSGLEIFPGLVRNVIVWDKGKIGMGYAWRRMHEWIGYHPLGNHKLRDQCLGDILRVPGVDNKMHPTEKPVAVLTPLIHNSTNAGDAVLDPFMGSGSILLACKKLDRRGIGIEVSEEYCEIAAQRLRQGVLDFSESA